jgi:hypothetical protein
MLCLLQAPYAFRLLTCPLPEPVSVSTYALLSFCRRTAEDARLPPDGRLSAGTTRPSAADIPSSFPSLPIVCALSSAPTCVPSRLRRSSCQVRTELEDPPLTTAPCYLLVSPPTACLSFTSPLSPRRQTVSTPHERFIEELALTSSRLSTSSPFLSRGRSRASPSAARSSSTSSCSAPAAPCADSCTRTIAAPRSPC